VHVKGVDAANVPDGRRREDGVGFTKWDKGGGGADRKRKRVMEKGRRGGGARKGGRELVKTKNESPVMSRTSRPSPQSNQWHMETKPELPARQAEQVEDDVAPVTAEYVPAIASDEEYARVDSNTSV
jgi:hypothetical protein